jgi:hypothetical protein
MPYDYIKKNYKFQPEVGRGVQHSVTKRFGRIAREDRGQGHYVQVKFQDDRHALPCHPDELSYIVAGEDTEFMGHPI